MLTLAGQRRVYAAGIYIYIYIYIKREKYFYCVLGKVCICFLFGKYFFPHVTGVSFFPVIVEGNVPNW